MTGVAPRLGWDGDGGQCPARAGPAGHGAVPELRCRTMLRGSTCSRPLGPRRSGTWTVVQGNAGGHRGHRVRLWGARRLWAASRPAQRAAAATARARRRDGPGRSAQPGLSPPAQPGWWRHRVRRRVRTPPRGRWWPTVASRRWRPSRRGRSSVRRAGHGRHASISECRHNGSPHFVAQNNQNNDADSAGIRVRSFAGDAVSRAAVSCSVIGQYGAARGQVHPFCSAAIGDLPARPGG